MNQVQVRSRKFDIRFDQGRHPRGKIGFVLLATEQTVQGDMIRIIPKGVGVHFTRVSNPDSITNQSLTDIAPDLARAAETLLPDGSLDVITYACTSGSLVLGEDRVHSLLNEGAPGARASSIIAAVVRALRAVNAQRVVVVTPYLDEINQSEKVYLEDSGFDVIDIQGLNLERDSEMVRVAPEFIAEMAIGLDREDADSIFISCGALRSLEIAQQVEDHCGKPVITSNQAMAWDALRLAGIQDTFPGYGKLLSDPKIIHRI